MAGGAKPWVYLGPFVWIRRAQDRAQMQERGRAHYQSVGGRRQISRAGGIWLTVTTNFVVVTHLGVNYH